MINFVMVEDNQEHRENVKKIIVSTMMKNKIEFKIKEFEDYTDKLIESIKNNKESTVYLLDLELPNGDGIDIARMIRNEYNDWTSPIIICTAHTSLAYEVYKQRLQILDFIGKYFDVEKNITEAIEICIKMLNKRSCYRYTYHNVDYCISYKEINYIQRNGRKTCIYTKNRTYEQNISINEIKKILPRSFVISTKGTILNVNSVKKIDWKDMKVYFKDGTAEYLVSPKHKKEIMRYEYN